MFGKTAKKIVSMLAAAVTAASNVMPVAAITVSAEPVLTYQSIELFPEGGDAETVITLDGMMPKGADAEAVDVSEEHEGIAAYDITIRDGWRDYQPGDAHPILVEISNPVITENITVWHIADDGTREEITDVTAKDGEVSFYATGFSVYEIVEPIGVNIAYDVVPISGESTYGIYSAGSVDSHSGFVYTSRKIYPETVKKITSIDQLESYISQNAGFYFCGASDGLSRFALNSITTDARSGIAASSQIKDKGNLDASKDNVNTHQLLYNAVKTNHAVPFYFESTGTEHEYYIYCSPDNGVTKNYIRNKDNQNNALAFANGKGDATPYTIEPSTNASNSFKIRTTNKLNGAYWYWNYRNDNNHPRFAATNGLGYGNNDYSEALNNDIYIWYYALDDELENDPYELDGESFGLINYQNSLSNALMAGAPVASQLRAMRLTLEDGCYTSPYAITSWRFNWVAGTDTYKISAVTGITADGDEIRQYLKLDSSGLSLTDELNASSLTVAPNSDGVFRLALPVDNLAIQYNNNNNNDLFRKSTDTVEGTKLFTLANVSSASTDVLGLDGNTYVLVHSSGNALKSEAASATQLSSQQMAPQTNSQGSPEYVYFGEISNWTFHHVDTNRYTISTVTDEGLKYLKLDASGLTLSLTPYILTVVPGTNDSQIKIVNTIDRCEVRKNGNLFDKNGLNPSSTNYFEILNQTSPVPTSDLLGLDGQTYGIVVSDGNAGHAFNAFKSNKEITKYTMAYDSDAGTYNISSVMLPGWTFHWTGGNQYTISDASGQYIKISGSDIQSTAVAAEATPLVVVTDGGKLVFYDPSSLKVISLTGSSFKTTAASNTTYPKRFDLVRIEASADIYGLDGKEFGLMYFSGGNATSGIAMMGTQKTETVLVSQTMLVKTNAFKPNGKLFVPPDSDITMWKFHSAGGDLYQISSDDGNYLKLTADGLTLVSSAAQASTIKVIRGTGADSQKIKLECDGYQVWLKDGYKSTAGGGTLLTFVEKSRLEEDDFIVYSAKKVGMSDKEEVPVIDPDTGAKVIDPNTGEELTETKYAVRMDQNYPENGKVIVYTRIWNNSEKQYDFYAVDHLGQLVPCSERGNSIMWVGSKINTLLWDFIEYYEPGTTNLNNYYELYNPYSEQYLVPLPDGTVLSPGTVGINLDARRLGDYSGKIIAWDDPTYDYYALKADVTTKQLKSILKKEALDETAELYFAIMEPLKPEEINEENDKLTPVQTIDNHEYGITMKMVDFPVERAYQNEALGNDQNGDKKPVPGILSTDLKNSGYPTTQADGGTRSLEDLFGSAKDVNHLFIQSIYNGSGYFEYDSCQNFASLKGRDEGDFTVYKEIGTMDNRGNNTDKHGQFMPYNDITPGVFSITNPKNINNVFGSSLPESDPRKYEKLYRVGNYKNNDATNWHFGMELSAGFVQTPDGHDSWGHDIIFEFTGDDDFWLYVDNELVIDLGGIHSALAGNVNFATGDVKVNGVQTTLYNLFKENYLKRKGSPAAVALAQMQTNHAPAELTLDEIQADETLKAEYEAILASIEADYNAEATAYADSKFVSKTVDGKTVKVFENYTSHKMKIFYMERGEGASNLHMRFNLSYVTPGSVVMSKDVSGAGDIDLSMLKYPYQIEYEVRENDHTKWVELDDSDKEHYFVYYLNPKKEADYYARYKSPVNNQIYTNVFFLTPGKDVSISFPDTTIQYRIKECGLNGDVYQSIQCNDEDPVTGQADDGSGKTFTISPQSVEDRPSVHLTNNVDPEKVKTLTFEKNLIDKDGNQITDDDTTFSFRLWLEEEIPVLDAETNDYIVTKQLKLAYMHAYYVVDPDDYVCEWSADQQKFVTTGVLFDNMTAAQKQKYVRETSIYGKISEIPAYFKVKVPNLLPGMMFRVEERESDNPIGYNVYQLNGYEPQNDEHTNAPSYNVISGQEKNTGTVIAVSSPHMKITNKRGWGIDVKKHWSDEDYVVSHDPIYIAVYIKGELKEDSVRKIGKINDEQTVSSQRYFFDTLEPGTTSLNDYVVREVTLDPPPEASACSDKGWITLAAGQTVTPIAENTSTSVSAILKDGSNTAQSFVYQVEYEPGKLQGKLQNARIDNITNIRNDGIAIRLFDWGDDTSPLAGGTFTLTLLEQGDTTAVPVGKGQYVSNANGIVTILYNVSNTGTYTLTQTAAPAGYIGMKEPITFTISETPDAQTHEYVTIQSNPNSSGWVDETTYEEVLQDKYKGVVDIHNKQFDLMAVKTDSSTNTGLAGAHFALYKGKQGARGQIVKDYYPMSGYGDLVSDDNGVIPRITKSLKPGTYYLTETKPPRNYTGITADIIFSIDALGYVTIGTEPADTTTISGQNYFVISVPNSLGIHDYYFDIEKNILVDKNIHDSDPDQKFVFKVERYAENDTSMNAVIETFYLTMNCSDSDLATEPFALTSSDKYELTGSGQSDYQVTVTYNTDDTYTFPAALFRKTQTVKVKEKGLYKVTEVSEWSSTDYDFWKGSNDYRDPVNHRGAYSCGVTEPYVAFVIDDHDAVKDDRPTVSFTNTETEFAYLTAQAYAENTIKRQS